MLSVVLFLFLARTPVKTAGVSDGTVKGTLTINGKSIRLTHVYGRKREAWPADAKLLSTGGVADLPCGIVEVLITNEALPDATLASILQNEYEGSKTIRGVRFVIDASGTHQFETLLLLESGSKQLYGMTQSNTEITSGRRYTGNVEWRNDDASGTKLASATFDTAIKLQYSFADPAERIATNALGDEFLRALPGEWQVERWSGFGCNRATGKLSVGERTAPHQFQAMLDVTTGNGEEVEEEVTITTAGTKVHFEGGKVSVPENVWIRDVLDFELRKNLLVGGGASDFVILRKAP